MRRWLVLVIVLVACTDQSPAPIAGEPSAPGANAPGTRSSTPEPSEVAEVGPDASTTARATAPADPVPATPAEDGVLPTGFDLAAARVTAADGATCDLCVWVADTGDRRRQGLMTVTDLGPADGMAFVYPAPTTTRFWMKDTPLPLSIAFFGIDGEFIESFDMQPCVGVDSGDCPRFPTPGGFVVAIETYQGGLAALDIGPGSSLELLDLPCQF